MTSNDSVAKGFIERSSPRQIKAFSTMWREGYETILIAERFSIHQGYVSDIAKALGLPKRERGKYKYG